MTKLWQASIAKIWYCMRDSDLTRELEQCIFEVLCTVSHSLPDPDTFIWVIRPRGAFVWHVSVRETQTPERGQVPGHRLQHHQWSSSTTLYQRSCASGNRANNSSCSISNVSRSASLTWWTRE